MKSKIFFGALLGFSALSFVPGAQAGGPADGIYYCNFTIAGLGAVSQYAAVTGRPDGTSVITFPAVGGSQVVTGYGIGNAANGVFAGSSDKSLPFTINYTSTAANGDFGYLLNGRSTSATTSCTKVF